MHDPVDAFYAIIDVHEGTGLLPISPDLDLTTIRCQSHLSTDSRWSLLPAPLVRTQGSIDVMEADYPRFKAIIFVEEAAQLFHKELLGTISLFWICGISVVFLQVSNLRTFLKVLWVDTS